MIIIDEKQRTVRECEAPFEYFDKGELKTEQIRVRYYSFTWGEIQSRHAELAALAKDNPDHTIWPHETLVDRIESLPDLKTADSKPFKITAKNLGNLDTKNLEAIKKAIDEDFAGK